MQDHFKDRASKWDQGVIRVSGAIEDRTFH